MSGSRPVPGYIKPDCLSSVRLVKRSGPPIFSAASGTTVLIVASDIQRAAIIEAGLASFTDAPVMHLDASSDFDRGLSQTRAGAVVIACDSPTRRTFDTLRAINATQTLPIVMFVSQCDPSQIDEAIAVGVCAFVVAGLHTDRIKPVMQVALSRFRAHQDLWTELQRTKSDLADRKTIERAKGILMERRRLTEAAAYNILRRSAMQDGKTIAEIASAIMAADRLLTA